MEHFSHNVQTLCSNFIADLHQTLADLKESNSELRSKVETLTSEQEALQRAHRVTDERCDSQVRDLNTKLTEHATEKAVQMKELTAFNHLIKQLKDENVNLREKLDGSEARNK